MRRHIQVTVIFTLMSTAWTTASKGETISNEPYQRHWNALEEFKNSLTPVEVGDPFLDDLLKDWFDFSTGSVEQFFRELDKPSVIEKDVMEGFKRRLEPEEVGDPLLDELLADWYTWATGGVMDFFARFREQFQEQSDTFRPVAFPEKSSPSDELPTFPVRRDSKK